ncbi:MULTISPECIES: tRNA pseudouridine(13) synthase TruD [unclassified Ectothiorhodospira]|uniref:tRNA pseudouridine(13) synthase TruD n=1 Tax=unclassified Ectothiorhodospira TaxID=2684909 RepID=UPI001EE8A6ED|nr:MULTISPECIES: tRNA pseudouridine(13) synthase TruD [unclassified Ectothiorhodospira]MCG5516129.1 tRNA pseudouridine(13) synthase TruD [Ectothiorhodospira sp. 9100]MCG5518596.1 tRNA pseudouridine(13) synthase TruD [Ectothiorhodospira sp. 9905]
MNAFTDLNTPLLTARLRAQPADFLVDELPITTPEGEGEHVWLQLRKTGLNTDQLAGMLARAAGLPRRAVSYAGLKDRQAVTTQWFSVHLPGCDAPQWSDHLPPEVEILAARRHRRKLQTGHLRGNRFHIRLRDCEGDRHVAEERLTSIAHRGLPNFFGEQRFGHDRGNLDKARALFAKEIRVRDRKLRGLYLSAARSEIFNRVLARRVEEDHWDQALPGDAMQLDGSRSFFIHREEDPTVAARVAAFEVHPTGPLWGQGNAITEGAAAQLEAQVMEATDLIELARGLEGAGLSQERRALRIRVNELSWSWLDAADLELRFELPAGAYATTVIAAVADTA